MSGSSADQTSRSRCLDARRRCESPVQRWGGQHDCGASTPAEVLPPPARVGRTVGLALRVVFADDNYLVREGVAALLAEVEGIDVVDTATDLDSLMRSVADHSPDVVLTDIRMPPTQTDEGIEAAKRIRAEHPGVGVVVLSQYVEEDYAFALLAEGAAGMGYLLKERVSDLDELVRALHEVARGGSALDPLVVEALLARRAGRRPAAGADRAGARGAARDGHRAQQRDHRQDPVHE